MPPPPTSNGLDPDTCWQAVQQRDASFDGRFWYAVRTTGVYCRPSCGARTPLRKNVAFHCQLALRRSGWLSSMPALQAGPAALARAPGTGHRASLPPDRAG
ncbi:Ada metal-binding domain-containing protein [Oceanisphaera psychrotolerans]|uniref:Ada metal-binding domain-containing protein n=1 Tax=Oceanisphaera psychrotolerans TaxID=1414654 RepID=UPI003CCC1E44